MCAQGPGKPKVYENSWIQAFNQAGYSVCGIDQQGLGFSEGARQLRCYVEAFDDYIRDVIQLRRYGQQALNGVTVLQMTCP